MARCSFDVHIRETMGSLMLGATVVMLRPRGTIDLNYLLEVFQKKQISAIEAVPSFFNALFTSLKEGANENGMKHIRSLISGGM